MRTAVRCIALSVVLASVSVAASPTAAWLLNGLVVDVDGDGALDLLVGDETGRIYYYHRSMLDERLHTVVANVEQRSSAP